MSIYDRESASRYQRPGNRAAVSGTTPANNEGFIIRGAIYRTGHGSLFIGSRLANGNFNLIGLDDGNRWSDSEEIPESWVRLKPGTDISITVGG